MTGELKAHTLSRVNEPFLTVTPARLRHRGAGAPRLEFHSENVPAFPSARPGGARRDEHDPRARRRRLSGSRRRTDHAAVDAAKTGPKIDRNLFGQFAEHLGKGIYEGVWVGPDSPIPNTRGIRNDVVAALKALKVPNVRWPGGCFADDYHWRKGIGRDRQAQMNPDWGGVIEPNTFGTHEFMDFIDQIGSRAYLSVNVGSGSPQEAAEWLEYLTAAQPTALQKERAANGHPEPYIIPLPRHRQRELGLRRQHDAGVLPAAVENVRALRRGTSTRRSGKATSGC